MPAGVLGSRDIGAHNEQNQILFGMKELGLDAEWTATVINSNSSVILSIIIFSRRCISQYSLIFEWHVHAQVCLALCDPVDCSAPGFSVHGIFQARIPEWVAISLSRGSSRPKDQICVSCVSCIGRRILYHCASWQQNLWLLIMNLLVLSHSKHESVSQGA